MKKVFSKRNLIIMFFPVVMVLVILTLGLPQQVLTAVTVGGERYTIAEYNFYYYEAYYNFANEHYTELGDLGLNLNVSLKSQDYDENTTWAQHFREVTLADMQEYAILCHEAEAAGFDASEEVAAVHAQQEELIRDYCVSANISDADKYLSQIYDAGMTESIYYEQLDRRTLAESYRSHLLEELTPTDQEAETYAAQALAGQEDYLTADIVVAYFPPAADRVTGESEERQWDNAGVLAQAAMDRAEANGGDLEAYLEVAAQFSQLEDEDHPDGHFASLTHEDVEEVLEAWCFDTSRQSGDAAVLRDDTGWYLVYFNGFGESVRTARAREELRQQRYDQWLQERQGDYPVQTNALGMLIAR